MGSKRPPPTAKPIGKCGGLRPTPFPVRFAVGWGCLDIKNQRVPARMLDCVTQSRIRAVCSICRPSGWHWNGLHLKPKRSNDLSTVVSSMTGHFNTLCYTIVFPGRKSSFQEGFRTDSNRESFNICPPAGRRAEFDALPVKIRPGRPISDPEALVSNIERILSGKRVQ